MREREAVRQKGTKEAFEPLQELAEVEAHGRQQGVEGIARRSGQPATAFAAVVLADMAE